MADSPSLLVLDTSLLIDFHAGGSLAELFRLPYGFVAPDVIIEELHEPAAHTIVALGLQRRELQGEQVTEVALLRSRYRKPSVNDLFALVLARHLRPTLLTSDRHLREAAVREQVDIHGTLWALDEMIRHEIVPAALASDALQRMLQSGSRLPIDEAQRRIKRWSGGC